MAEGPVEPPAAGPSRQRGRSFHQTARLGSETAPAVAPDRRVLDPEPVKQPERLGEVTRGDLDLVPARLQVRDHGPHHEHVG